MKQTFGLFLSILWIIPAYAAASDFDQYFIDKTIRLDYVHAGTAHDEWFAYDEVIQEPQWAGCKDKCIDGLDLGKYRFSVFLSGSDTAIYSRGFCSIYGEWETTGEAAKGIQRSFHESIRFPWPKKPVDVVLEKRDSLNVFMPLWTMRLDPAHANFRKHSMSSFPVSAIMKHGESHNKVDIVILPDGYTRDNMDKFLSDARRLCHALFSLEPYNRRKQDFNVWAVQAPSQENGIDSPRDERYCNTALSTSFNAFESDRYALTWANKAVRNTAACAPYDFIYILFNSEKYGGGGIFNLYATCASDNQWSAYIFTHEFGHSFAGLADEYYTSDVAYSDFYPLSVEPWEPNITTLTVNNPVKWADCMKTNMDIPTPWDKEAFDAHQSRYTKERRAWQASKMSQSEKDSVIQVNDQWVSNFLRGQPHWGDVGVYEGAGYASKKIYRPYLDCRMFTRSLTGFCPVCIRAIETSIDFYTTDSE